MYEQSDVKLLFKPHPHLPPPRDLHPIVCHSCPRHLRHSNSHLHPMSLLFTLTPYVTLIHTSPMCHSYSHLHPMSLLFTPAPYVTHVVILTLPPCATPLMSTRPPRSCTLVQVLICASDSDRPTNATAGPKLPGPARGSHACLALVRGFQRLAKGALVRLQVEERVAVQVCVCGGGGGRLAGWGDVETGGINRFSGASHSCRSFSSGCRQ